MQSHGILRIGEHTRFSCLHKTAFTNHESKAMAHRMNRNRAIHIPSSPPPERCATRSPAQLAAALTNVRRTTKVVSMPPSMRPSRMVFVGSRGCI